MASNVSPPQEHDPIHGSRKLKVTILASEWGSTKGGLSTINRELAIQLAKFSYVEVTFFLPKCSDEDKKVADGYFQWPMVDDLSDIIHLFYESYWPQGNFP